MLPGPRGRPDPDRARPTVERRSTWNTARRARGFMIDADTAAASWEPVASLVPFAGNPRKNERSIPVVADSIRRFGFGAPVVARAADRMVLAGHTRLAAAGVLAQRWEKATTRERQGLVEAAWQRNKLLLHQQIIWVKARPILTRSHFMWQHEPAFYGWVEGKPPARRPPLGGENTTVWTIDQQGESDGIHPTQKPLEIFERPIGYHTAAGDLVYEPFCGSGSQLIAAARLGRRCCAMELAPQFVDVIRRRWTGYARSAGIDPGPGALE